MTRDIAGVATWDESVHWLLVAEAGHPSHLSSNRSIRHSRLWLRSLQSRNLGLGGEKRSFLEQRTLGEREASLRKHCSGMDASEGLRAARRKGQLGGRRGFREGGRRGQDSLLGRLT